MNDAPYERKLLAADDTSETLAMIWRDGASCAPHDHGAAGGTIHVVSGGVVERRYVFRAGELRVVSESTARAPAILTIAPGVIHDMRAAAGTITIHHYTPRIHAMRVYDCARRETLVVADDCGAWVPDDAQVIERIPWPARSTGA